MVIGGAWGGFWKAEMNTNIQQVNTADLFFYQRLDFNKGYPKQESMKSGSGLDVVRSL